jgi:hypothetical protein
VTALAPTASEAADGKSVTIRVLVQPVTRRIKDVPPKTARSRGEWSKGDTLSGTSILRNFVPQFGKPKGARVGTSSFTDIALASQMVREEGVARLPGGTVHVRGVVPIGPTVKLPVVGALGSTREQRVSSRVDTSQTASLCTSVACSFPEDGPIDQRAAA